MFGVVKINLVDVSPTNDGMTSPATLPAVMKTFLPAEPQTVSLLRFNTICDTVLLTSVYQSSLTEVTNSKGKIFVK